MTSEQYIAQTRARIAVLKDGKALAIAAQDTHVKMSVRIFDNNENAQDGKIGEYNSTDPIYVNPDKSPKKFPKKGKEGKTKFKNGNQHKTGFFESYKYYRGKIGRKTSEVDLKLSGALQSNFTKGLAKKDVLTWTIGVSQDSADKIEGAEKRYGNIFRLTPKERTSFKQVLSFETFKILK